MLISRLFSNIFRKKRLFPSIHNGYPLVHSPLGAMVVVVVVLVVVVVVLVVVVDVVMVVVVVPIKKILVHVAYLFYSGNI